MARMQDRGKRKWEAIKACGHMMIFFVFLATYTAVLVDENLVSERYLRQAVIGQFSSEGWDPNTVQSRIELEDYFENGLIHALYGDTHLHPSDKLVNLSSLGGDEFAANVILGAVQLRQLRVQKNTGCEVLGTYADFYTICIPPYGVGIEQKDSYGGPEEDPFLYYNNATLRTHTGAFATYEPGGFVRLLSNNNVTAARHEMWVLKTHKWIDTETRAIFVDFNVWNPNLSIYAVTRLLFELTPSAEWHFSIRVNILKPRHLAVFGSLSSKEWVLAITELCLALFMLYYIAEEIAELFVGIGEYLSDGWNILDWITLILLGAHFALRGMNIMGAGYISAIGHDEMMDAYKYVDLQHFAENSLYVRQINAFNIMLVWIKCVKYVPMFPYANVLKLLVAQVWKFFVSFFVIFVLFFAGFALAYTTGFGSFFPELQSWPAAWFFLARGLIGNVDVTIIYKQNKLAGSVLTCLFVLGVYMVLLNVFYALMLYAYSQTREAMLQRGASPEDDSESLVTQLKKAVLESADWEKTLKKFFPGLHARTLMTWRRHENKIKKRLERRVEIEQGYIRQMAMDKGKSGYTLMPFNATFGTGELNLTDPALMDASKPGHQDNESDASDKSMDLGPLSPPIVKKKMDYNKRMGIEDPINVPMQDLQNAVMALGDQLSARINYVGAEVKQEMVETREVMGGIRDVIGLLKSRVTDLDNIQKASL